MYSSNESCSSDGKRWHILLSGIVRFIPDNSTSLLENKCDSYLLFHFETNVGIGTRSFLYVLGLAYCFIGLSAITACFFRSMENIVKQTREIVYVDPGTGAKRVRRERIWNYTLADISLLALGTSFPQISLSTVDAFQNLGQRYAGGLGPATLVGSAAFDLYPIHAICVVVPRAGTVKKISDLGVWLVELTWSFWAYVWLYIIIEENVVGKPKVASRHSWMTSLVNSLLYTGVPNPGGFKPGIYWHGTSQMPDDIGNNCLS